ncbi:hypothetical protein [Limnospira indica]|nr:hypothetical protein [Limnospira indica]
MQTSIKFDKDRQHFRAIAQRLPRAIAFSAVVLNLSPLPASFP